jgi:hypothetical protein
VNTPGDIITAVFTDGFIANNCRFLYVPNKTPDLRNEKSFPNGMCPINVKKTD